MDAFDGPARKTLETNLATWWCEALDVSSVGLDQDFFQLGGDPERGQRVLHQVREKFKVSIPAEELYEARTIGKLADLIQMKTSSQEQQCVIPIRAGGERRPLFLIHGVGGNILGFAGLAKVLNAHQPVYGIQAQALQSDRPTLTRLEAMAAYYVQEVRRVQSSGPYAFLGFSFGGLVAYEMAQQLVASGERVHFLGMLDTWQPSYLKKIQAAEPRLTRIWNRINLVRLNTRKLSLIQLVPYAYVRLKARVLQAAYGRMASTGMVSLPDSMRRVREINLMAAARYQVKSYPGQVCMFRAKDDTARDLPEDLNWRSSALGGVEIFRLPGDHGQILAEPNLSYMAAHVEQCLARAIEPLQDWEEFEVGHESLVRLDRLPTRHFAYAGMSRKALE